MIRYVLQFKCNIFSLNQKKYVKFIVFYLRIGSLRKERIPRFPAPDRSAGKRGRRPHTYYLIVRNAPKQDAEALFGFESAAYIYKLFNNTLRRRRFREIRENSIFPRGMSDTGFRSGKARPPTSGGGSSPARRTAGTQPRPSPENTVLTGDLPTPGRKIPRNRNSGGCTRPSDRTDHSAVFTYPSFCSSVLRLFSISVRGIGSRS